MDLKMCFRRKSCFYGTFLKPHFTDETSGKWYKTFFFVNPNMQNKL